VDTVHCRRGSLEAATADWSVPEAAVSTAVRVQIQGPEELEVTPPAQLPPGARLRDAA